MIDSDATGQKKLEEIRKGFADWTEFEENFLLSTSARTYATLTPRQKSTVGTMHDKLVGR